MTKKQPKSAAASKPSRPKPYFPTAVTEYFRDIFLRPFDNQLLVLFTTFAADNFYIVAKTHPDLLMAGGKEARFGFIDLRNESSERQEQIREIVTCFRPPETTAYRMDVLMQALDRATEETGLPEIYYGFDEKESENRWWLTAKGAGNPGKLSWDVGEGFYRQPLRALRHYYEKLKDDEREDDAAINFSTAVPGEKYRFEIDGETYSFIPTLGVDYIKVSHLKKKKTATFDTFITQSTAPNVYRYGHAVNILYDKDTGKRVRLLMSRPDVLLIPRKDKST